MKPQFPKPSEAAFHPRADATADRVRIGEPVPFAWVGMEWYAATVRANADLKVRDWLEGLGLPVLVLEGREARRVGPRNGRRRLTDYPVLPGIVFVAELERVLAAMRSYGRFEHAVNGVRHASSGRGADCPLTGFLGCDGRPLRVGGATMGVLFAAHERALFVKESIRDSLRADMHRGDSVLIEDGPFAWTQGIVEKFRAANRVEILVEMFGRRQVVEVALDSVSRIDN